MFLVLFLFSITLSLFFFDAVGLTDLSNMSSIRIWGLVFLVLAFLWALITPDKLAPKIPLDSATADEWRRYRAEKEEWDKPDPIITLKMLILTSLGGMALLFGLVSGVGLLIIFFIARINSTP